MAGDRAKAEEQEKVLEQLLGNLLRWGVLTAAAIVVVGGIIYLVRHGAASPDYSKFAGEPAIYRELSKIFSEAFSGGGRGLIQLGLLVLIATPIARVAFSLFMFLKQRDRIYVVVTLIVLSALLYGLLGPGL